MPTLENRFTREASSFLRRKEISEKIVNQYKPEVPEVRPVQIVEYPIFCESCGQTTVQVARQSCNNCINKIINADKKTFKDFALLCIGVFSSIALFVLVFNLISLIWETLVR